ncbi:MAG: PilZ domain-containing protein, partial [Treponema sp.]|nr:PilZ domain-containing protein [Treponema sp.]
MSDIDNVLGKKVFFLYPSAVIQNTIIQELIQQEFEIYIAKDPAALQRGLKKYPASVVFININEGMDASQCETWIRSVLGTPETTGVGIGILSGTNDENLRKKFTDGIKVPCGFTVIKSDVTPAIRQILESLRVADAKGRRKYLRAVLENGGTINLPFNSTFVHGVIKDISAVGFSCVLDQNPVIAKNVLFQDIQIKLQSQILKVEGIVLGSRQEENGSRCYVILFTQRVDP